MDEQYKGCTTCGWNQLGPDCKNLLVRKRRCNLRDDWAPAKLELAGDRLQEAEELILEMYELLEKINDGSIYEERGSVSPVIAEMLDKVDKFLEEENHGK